MAFNRERLAELMRGKRETAYRLSKRIGVAQSTVWNWLKGKSCPQLDHLGALADHFGVDDEELLL